MSVDNGIYILESAGPEFRVTEVMAVENLWWQRCSIHGSNLHYGNMVIGQDENNKPIFEERCSECTSKTDGASPQEYADNCREVFGSCQIFLSKEEALMYAAELLENMDICEYGISFLTKMKEPFVKHEINV